MRPLLIWMELQLLSGNRGERLIHLGRRPRWNCPNGEGKNPTYEEQDDIALGSSPVLVTGTYTDSVHMRNSSLNNKFAASSRDLIQWRPSSFLDPLKLDVSPFHLNAMVKNRPSNDPSVVEKSLEGNVVREEVVQIGHTPEFFTRWQNIMGDRKRYFGTSQNIPAFQLPPPPSPQWKTLPVEIKSPGSQRGHRLATSGVDNERFRDKPSFKYFGSTRPHSSSPSKRGGAKDFKTPASSPFDLTEGITSPRQVGNPREAPKQEIFPSLDVIRWSSLEYQEPTVDIPLHSYQGDSIPVNKLRPVTSGGTNRLRSHWNKEQLPLRFNFTRRPKHSGRHWLSGNTVFKFDPSPILLKSDFQPTHSRPLLPKRVKPKHLRNTKRALAPKKVTPSNPLNPQDRKPKIALMYQVPRKEPNDPFYNVYQREMFDFMKMDGDIGTLEKFDRPSMAHHPLPAFKLRPPAPPLGSPFKRYARRKRMAGGSMGLI